MNDYIPILGDIYTRKNGKKYEIREHLDASSVDACCDSIGKQCAFYNKNCEGRYCDNVVYIRRKDLE